MATTSNKQAGIKFGGNKSRPDLQKVNEPKTRQGKTELFNKGGNTMASKMNPGFMAMMAKKKGAQEGSKADMASDKKQMMGMKKGGMPSALAKHAAKPASKAHAGLKAGGMTKMAKGGGIETKGKTKGTMITMKNGGKAC